MNKKSLSVSVKDEGDTCQLPEKEQETQEEAMMHSYDTQPLPAISTSAFQTSFDKNTNKPSASTQEQTPIALQRRDNTRSNSLDQSTEHALLENRSFGENKTFYYYNWLFGTIPALVVFVAVVATVVAVLYKKRQRTGETDN